MKTVHPQPIGLPASFNDKFNMLTDIVNASIGTQREFRKSTMGFVDENSTFNVYEINKGLLCFDATIDTALITLLGIVMQDNCETSI